MNKSHTLKALLEISERVEDTNSSPVTKGKQPPPEGKDAVSSDTEAISSMLRAGHAELWGPQVAMQITGRWTDSMEGERLQLAPKVDVDQRGQVTETFLGPVTG